MGIDDSGVPATARRDPGEGRFAITVAFDLEPGARERFAELVEANAAASVADEPGCLRFDVLRPAGAEAPDVLLYEIYAGRAAFVAHLATPHYRAFDEATRAMIRRKTVLECTVTEHAKDMIQGSA